VDEIRVNFSYVSCLLEIAKARGGVHDVKGKGPAAEERAFTLGILACGAFGQRRGRECSRSLIGKCTGILRNLAPFPPPSSIASVDLDKEILLPVLVPVVSSVSLEEATEAVRVLGLKVRQVHSSIPSLTECGGK
jgi:hypothetical protein